MLEEQGLELMFPERRLRSRWKGKWQREERGIRRGHGRDLTLTERRSKEMSGLGPSRVVRLGLGTAWPASTWTG